MSTNATWYKDAIIYQLHVRSFFDSNADGIGDFLGLASKLDYLQDLGVTALWLLPFYPSPLRDDGYDIADYNRIHPTYGTMADFRAFLREAHRRDLRVITELVINHTSDQHPWFQRARMAPPGSPERNFYVWSDTPDRFRGTRIIFQDFEPSNWTWDDVAGQYYWHRFYHHQPDLNFDNPKTRQAVMAAMDFWMRMGVDGMRLDAIPYLFERDGTNNENLPETHEFLKQLRAHLDERFDDRMLLAEANQWPEDAVAYFGEDDECHMSYHFPLMPRLFMAVRSEDRFPIMDILQQTPDIPDSCQWAFFLRNHDELTLEMVTDEERDYMYRSYANDPQMRVNLGIRRRLAPLLNGNRRLIELMNGLLFSLLGTPILYYGDELGMGDNIYLGDRNGVRTPMQWSADRNAGFSTAHPHRLFLPVIIDPEYHYEFVNVESQQNNPSWLLWWMKRLISLRKQHPAFGRGTVELLHPENHKVLAFIRRDDNEQILVVANLSRFSQAVELDLPQFAGYVPVELFGQAEFPRLGEQAYPMSLGPHAFYWFALTPGADRVVLHTDPSVPELAVRGPWHQALTGTRKPALEGVLRQVLSSRRWFAGKAKAMTHTTLLDVVPIDGEPGRAHAYLALVSVEYRDGEPDVYAVPVTYLASEEGAEVELQQVLARIRSSEGNGFLLDGARDERTQRALLETVVRRRVHKSERGQLSGHPGRHLRRWLGDPDELLPRSLRAEQSNSSVVYGNRVILKVYRRLYDGVNPDLEVGRYLTEQRQFQGTPRVVGHLEYHGPRGRAMTAGVLQEYVDASSDAWAYTLEELDRYYERVLAAGGRERRPPDIPSVTAGAEVDTSMEARELLGPYLEAAISLGERTADLHLALGSTPSSPEFAPMAFSELYQRSLYQSIRSDLRRGVQALRRAAAGLPESDRSQVETVIKAEVPAIQAMRALTAAKFDGQRIRIHGDFHLGQLLYTGRDFIIIDFEGEPARPLSERKIKRSPLRDVAGLMRSLHYAAYTPVLRPETSTVLRSEDTAAMVDWAAYWYELAGSAYLRGYLERMTNSELLPSNPEHLHLLLRCFMLQKAMYEVTYELNNRPDWVGIPIAGAVALLTSSEGTTGTEL